MTHAIGLSVGATRFAGVVPGQLAVTRQSVLTLYRHRPPELGVPSENPGLDEPGVVVSGFAERSGDPVGIVAGDGAIHPGEVLVAAALRAMLYTVTSGRPAQEPVAVAYPAHWRPAAIHALRRALAALPEWPGRVTLVPDAVAAVAALQSQRGVPARGVVAVCDFGGTGTSITLLDAADGYRPIGPTVRHTDFSGDLVDRALMTRVLADAGAGGSAEITGTSALGALTRLRAECRGAKERLSGAAVTALHVDVPGFRGDVRLTREELDEEIRAPLAGVVAVLRDTLDRDGIRAADLSAVVSIGGGARIPAVTTSLSHALRVPVLTAPRPELSSAEGAALRVAHGSGEDRAATTAAPAIVMAGIDRGDTGPQSSTMRALAWSEAHDLPPVAPVSESYDETPAAVSARPQLSFTADGSGPGTARPPWYRRSSAILGVMTAAFALLTASAVAALGSDISPEASTSQVGPAIPVVPAPEGPAADGAGNPAPIPTRTVVVEQQPAPQRAVPAPPAARVPAAAPAPAARPPVVISAPPTIVQAPPTIISAPPTTSQAPAPPTTQPAPPPSDPPTVPPSDPPSTEPPATEPPPADPPSTEPPPAEDPSTGQQPPPTQQPPLIPQIPIPDIPGVTVPLIEQPNG